MNWCVVPMEPPPLLGHGGPLLLEVLQEFTQGLDGVGDIGCVDGCAPDDDVYIDEASQVKKHQEHLLGPTGVCPHFKDPGCPFGIHCLLCFLVSRV